jgi:hypothetical protein
VEGKEVENAMGFGPTRVGTPLPAKSTHVHLHPAGEPSLPSVFLIGT